MVIIIANGIAIGVVLFVGIALLIIIFLEVAVGHLMIGMRIVMRSHLGSNLCKAWEATLAAWRSKLQKAWRRF